jgi:hypothetical protein
MAMIRQSRQITEGDRAEDFRISKPTHNALAGVLPYS